ncbi:polysaccharide deacetylase family protein [Candidatus Borrarchaeum sp.]|uniref:polysaccharide deacetylase family protein n=1 Tax=Candidatus Borrarchaeum sp. TaxID=2846742 RepID=UPI0025802777|nr:polysaccharide deacetylase family protein [Candidatus Borrarchaeum sp.]
MKIKYVPLVLIIICIFGTFNLHNTLLFFPSPPVESAPVNQWFAEDANVVVSLTFDAEGDEIQLNRLISFLDSENINATFMLKGETCEKYPALVKRIAHKFDLGSHTYTHPLLTEISKEAQLDEIQRSKDIIYRTTGKYPSSFRAPYCDGHKSYNKYTFENLLLSEIYIDSSIGTVTTAPISPPKDLKQFFPEYPYPYVIQMDGRMIIEIPWIYPSDSIAYDNSNTLDQILYIWKLAFEYCYEQKGVYVLLLHPGRTGKYIERITLLKTLIEFMRQYDGVYFSSISTIASRFSDWKNINKE